LVGIKQRIGKKEGKQRIVSEGREENLPAPMMELSDGFMEQVEAIAKELRNISGVMISFLLHLYTLYLHFISFFETLIT
jgi:hypothetical protein